MEGGVIIPALPNDIAVQVIARLPRARHAALSGVSHAWREVLHPLCSGTIASLRKALNISETWLVYVSLTDGNKQFCFLFIDPAFGLCTRVTPPPPPGQLQQPLTAGWWPIRVDRFIHLFLLKVAGSKIFIPVIEPPFCRRLKWLCFDALHMHWQDCTRSPWPKQPPECHYLDRAVVNNCLYMIRKGSNDTQLEFLRFEDALELWISMGEFCFPAMLQTVDPLLDITFEPSYQIFGVRHQLLVIFYAKRYDVRTGTLHNCFDFPVIFSTEPMVTRPLAWKVWPINHQVMSTAGLALHLQV